MLPSETLAKYVKTRVYLETGVYNGDSIMTAKYCGFQEIHGVEAVPHILEDTKKFLARVYENDTSIHLHLGKSDEILYDTIKDIKEPITFFLDAHYQGANEELRRNPIFEELEQIQKHAQENGVIHTILIDDVRLFTKENFAGITKEKVEQKLLEINPNYKIVYEQGFIANDILVAHI